MYIELLIFDDYTHKRIDDAIICMCFSNEDRTSYQSIKMKTNEGHFIIKCEPIVDEYSKVIFSIEKEGYKIERFEESISKLDNCLRSIYLK